ncbi:MAG: C25 family cysteine peptidase [Planctomycetota bacterium]
MFARALRFGDYGRTLVVVLFLLLLVTTAAGREGNYLVITAPFFDNSTPLNELITWKSTQGFDVSVYSVPSGTSNTNIKSYITALWGTPDAPDFVLLVGDTSGTTSTQNTIPHFTGGASKHCVTDLPYSCMDGGDDWSPDLCVGRFSVTSLDELQVVVDKTIFVETGNFPDPDYVKRGAFLANPSTQGMAEPTHDWIIENLFEPNEYIGVKLYSSQGANTQDVTNAVNNGCLWVGYYGHSGSTGWWDPSFYQANVQGLSNAGLYGVAWSFSCNVGKYSIAECFGETWLREENKGAAVVIFPSDYIYWGSVEAWEPSTTLEQSFFRAFFENGIWEVGPAWHDGLRTFLYESPSNMDVKRNFFELYNLMGDPSLLLPQMAGFTLEVDPLTESTCSPPTDQVDFTIDIGQLADYGKFITVEAVGTPAGSIVDFSVNNSPPPFTSVMTIGNLSNCEAGTYNINVIATATDDTQHIMPITLSISTALPAAVTLLSPADEALDVARNPILSWEPDTEAANYALEVALDADFTNVVYSATVIDASHLVTLRLDSETTYYWHVCGLNGCGDGAFSATYSFTTIGQADYFTQQFTSGFDLEYLTLTFTPDGSGNFYALCGEEAAELPVDPAGGTSVSLGDDGFALVTVSGETVPFYGVAYDRYYIGSNGFVTFTGGDTDYSETLAEHFSIPRIAPLYDDLYPPGGGTISWKQLADRAVVTFDNVPEISTSNSNTFQVEMFFDGMLRITWLRVDVNDAIVGLSAGGGMPDDYVAYDLSAAGPCVAACCHGYVCYDVDPADAASITECLEAGGTYHVDMSCAEYTCDCGGSDYRGDANCLGDGVDAYDIDGFILAVGAPADWMAAYSCNLFCANDINCDGEVNAYDIDGFIGCVGAGACDPCP